jgi:hypothetical protein
MSWEIINQVLGLAAIDSEFARMLLADPDIAIQARGFQLTPEEQSAFQNTFAKNLQELSQQLIDRLHYDEFQQE